MNLEFLPLREDHLDAVLAIEKLSFDNPWTRAMFEREVSLPISRFYVARLDGRIIGYGGFWKIEDEAHIINLAVHPDFRSRGIGCQILRYLLKNIGTTDVVRVLLEVRKSNQPAQRLYESHGFTVIGVRPKYYVTEDAIVMEKLLAAG